MTTMVRFRERAGRAWLEVDYDGLAPPRALFDDLAMVGWAPPPPAPPPADALDWTRPDPATGRRCSVRPFRVVGARVGPPPGSGPGGLWTPGERSAFVATLHGILRRHGSMPDAEVAVAEPPDAPPPVVAPAPAGSGAARVTVLVPLAAAPAVRAHLEATAADVAFEPAALELPRTYRGNTFVEQVPGQRLSGRVDAARLDEVLDGLGRTLGIDPRASDRVVVAVDEGSADPGPAGADEPVQADDPGPPGRAGLRLVS